METAESGLNHRNDCAVRICGANLLKTTVASVRFNFRLLGMSLNQKGGDRARMGGYRSISAGRKIDAPAPGPLFDPELNPVVGRKQE